ncbi:hypothetical protein PSI9734_02183 [Pseudidiomarina piscicola]|uniref:Uncharacterized protein n=1 Tax=Pseudidiomarina piscicola TaxID=2614830 RepID=A0A776EIU2_9GAMM|nr:hypothetical protein [Pseudidiomarina piscicola]CAB0151823.1 hypothetical protein PSI9734_02183 [Pseudidiomarina piscicola]VZT41269.1 hypothetical protein PSI9734_02183 [Pseudomonas aeruginosa]
MMNIEILKELIQHENEVLESYIKESVYHRESVYGVIKKLIDEGGQTNKLVGKQVKILEQCIQPVFNHPCPGLSFMEFGCYGDNIVEPFDILHPHESGDYLCNDCQHVYNEYEQR